MNVLIDSPPWLVWVSFSILYAIFVCVLEQALDNVELDSWLSVPVKLWTFYALNKKS